MDDLYVIVGLGKTGLSCANFLHHKNIPFAITDDRLEPPGLAEVKKNFPQAKLSLGAFDEGLLLSAKKIIISPGISLNEPAFLAAKKKQIPFIGDIELFADYVNAPVVAITGTNAKSTVTTLVGEMIAQSGLRVAVGGNLGMPALDLLTDPAPDFYVLEISSFQLDTTESLLPRVATILNISPDHLDRYENYQTYIQSKQRIYKNCAVAVYNRNDELTIPQQNNVECITFGLDTPSEGMFGLRQNHLAFGQQLLMPIHDLKIFGKHNWANALAALALGHALELPIESMRNTLKRFTGLPHRCQWVRQLNEVDWYNDSKATNVGATCSALEGLSEQVTGKIILIAGGDGKNADFRHLQKSMRHCVKQAILIGASAKEIAEIIEPHIPTIFANDLQHAVLLAHEMAEPKDAVLLAPACASFDMFRDYNHRGEVFTQAVLSL